MVNASIGPPGSPRFGHVLARAGFCPPVSFGREAFTGDVLQNTRTQDQR